MPYTQEQIKERYDKLPADIKQAMDSVDTSKTIVNIGEKHDLMYDQISELMDEIGLVMVGLTPSKMFVSNISRRMQVDIGKAMLVAKDVNKEVFDKMRDSLKKIEGADEEGYSDDGINAAQKNTQANEDVPLTEEEKAQKKSVISAVEQAGGFIIDKQEDAPLQAEEMVHNALKESLELKKGGINILEKTNAGTPAKTIDKTVAPAVTQSDQERSEALQKAANSILGSISGLPLPSKKSEKPSSPVSPNLMLGDTPELQNGPSIQQSAQIHIGKR